MTIFRPGRGSDSTTEHVPASASSGTTRAPVNVTESLSDLVIRNPAPDASPSREPTGVYRIVQFNR